jgi:hypothetical protein
VFYPYGRIGTGYVVPTPQRRGIELFLRRWLIGLTAVALMQVVLQVASGFGAETLIFAAAYLMLGATYVARMAAFARRLKVLPMQVAASA